MRLRSGPEHRLARTAAHASLLSIHDVKKRPDARRPTGSRLPSPRRGAGLYARGSGESNNLSARSAFQGCNEISRQFLFISRTDSRLGFHPEVSSIGKASRWAENLPLTAIRGEGMLQKSNRMFQFVNRSGRKICNQGPL